MPRPNEISDFWRQVDRTDNCWNWTGTKPSGRYGRFKFKGQKFAAHRFSWVIHRGPIPAALHVLHHCDNPGCVRPDHLFLGTHNDNMQDKAAKGRVNVKPGSSNHNAKITEETARRIRALYVRGKTRQVDIAAATGIAQTTVSRILRREAWSHI